jgi:DNA-binding GntR family transcriptional regulator
MVPTILTATRSQVSQSIEAYRRIKERIITLKLPPASFIDETQLSEELGIGRTPIREALIRLSLENLIIILPRRGTIVADLNASDMHKLYEIRLALETTAVRLAAERATAHEIAALEEWSAQAAEAITVGDVLTLLEIDIEGHRLFVQATHNEFLADAIERLLGPSLRLCYWFAARQKLHALAPAIAEQRQIVEAIKAGDGEQAAALMHRHITDFQAALLTIR